MTLSRVPGIIYATSKETVCCWSAETATNTKSEKCFTIDPLQYIPPLSGLEKIGGIGKTVVKEYMIWLRLIVYSPVSCSGLR